MKNYGVQLPRLVTFWSDLPHKSVCGGAWYNTYTLYMYFVENGPKLGVEYRVVKRSKKTWHSAREDCIRKNYTSLASVVSQEEMDFLKQYSWVDFISRTLYLLYMSCLWLFRGSNFVDNLYIGLNGPTRNEPCSCGSPPSTQCTECRDRYAWADEPTLQVNPSFWLGSEPQSNEPCGRLRDIGEWAANACSSGLDYVCYKGIHIHYCVLLRYTHSYSISCTSTSTYYSRCKRMWD